MARVRGERYFDMTRPMRGDRRVSEEASLVGGVAGSDTTRARRQAGAARCSLRRSIACTTRLALGLCVAVLATVATPVSASSRLRLPRPFASSVIVNQIPTVNVPTVKAALDERVQTIAGDAEDTKVVTMHSRAFNEFMEKFAKADVYCPNSTPPCAESTLRESVFLENLLAIETHNKENEGGMKLGVTRFADLTPEEFQNHHGHKNTGADEALHGMTTSDGVNGVHGNALNGGLEAPRNLNGEVKADTTSDALKTKNGLGGVTTRVAKLGAGGPVDAMDTPRGVGSISRLGQSDVGDDSSSAGGSVDGGKVYDCSGSVSRAVMNAAKTRFATNKPHSKPFTEFVERFGKRTSYCGYEPSKFPCEESYRREILLLRNIRHIDMHNAARKETGGMKKVVTRFADLTPDEFAANHATYDGSGGGLKGDKKGQGKTVSNYSGDVSSNPSSDSLDMPRRALVTARREQREASRASLAATDAQLGWATGLASLGEVEPLEFNEPTDESGDFKATLGAFEAAEQALLEEEEDLARDAALAFESKTTTGDDVAHRDVFNSDTHADKLKQSVIDYASSLGKMQTVTPGEIDLPDSLDWRAKMDIGPLYSQGACSGCWAYSTVQVIADSKLISTGHRPSPSPYYLLSCDELDSGCNTGNMATAYAWIQTQPRGLLSAEEYPTTGGSCVAGLSEGEDSKTQKPPGVTIDGFCEIPPLRGQETIHSMLRALKQQPVAVGMNVKPLQLYGGGLVQMSDCPPASEDQISAINHAAVVVGWGVDEDSQKPYWLVKNSYGQDWGENGYVRLEMAFHEDSNYGVCGFFSEQNYPLTDGRDCAEGSNKKWSEKRGEDVYLMPDNVVVLPNGGGILTPARIKVFGYDLTTILKFASFACFALCVFFLAVEVFYCVSGTGIDDSQPATPASAITTPIVSPERGFRKGYGSRGN